MNEKLEKELIESYPLLFAAVRSEESTSPIYCYGIECGDGWFKIINDLCASLEPKIRNWNQKNPDENYPRLAQLKEKFGGLRFYVDFPYDFNEDIAEEMSELISLVESKSYKVCEDCGDSGERRGGSYIRTLCNACKERKVK